MSELYVQSSSSIQGVISRLTTLLGDFDKVANDIRSEHKTLVTKWEGDASTAFHDTFVKQEPNLTNFHDAIDEYIKALTTILGVYEQAEQKNVGIASK